MNPRLAKSSWFVVMNIRNLLHFERLIAISEELQLSFYIRRRGKFEEKPGSAEARTIMSLIAVIYLEHGESAVRSFIKKSMLSKDPFTGNDYKPIVVRQDVRYI